MKRHNLLRGAALVPLLSGLAVATACQAPTSSSAPMPDTWAADTYQPAIPVSHPPFDEFHVTWLGGLEEGYVYMDHHGSYTDTGAHIPALLREMKAQGLESAGPPFCLFYDDPARTPREQLRSRACVPIAGVRSPRAPLFYDVLPGRNVVLACVTGPYSEAPRAYPKMFEYMDRFGWVADGPIMERYIVPPAMAKAPSDHLCEIRIPYAPRGR